MGVRELPLQEFITFDLFFNCFMVILFNMLDFDIVPDFFSDFFFLGGEGEGDVCRRGHPRTPPAIVPDLNSDRNMKNNNKNFSLGIIIEMHDLSTYA